MEDENNPEEDTKQCASTSVPEIEVKREEILKNHIQEMKEEISQWKHTYNAIKSKYHEIENFTNDVILDWDQCKEYLTEEDMEFLNSQPNYEDLPAKLEKAANGVEIRKHQLRLKKVKTINKTIADNQSVQKYKQELCKFLLNWDEGNNLSYFNDSGNCTFDEAQFEEKI